MLYLHRVPHGVDIRVRGFHPLVHRNAALNPQLQPRFLRKSSIRSNANGQHHHVGVEGRSVLQQHVHAAAVFRKPFHGTAQGQLDPMPAHFGVDECGHIRVKGIHQLFGTLDNRDLHPQLPQVFRQLQADEAAAGQHRRPGMMLVDVFLDAEGVLHCPQSEHPLQPDTGDLRLGGLGPGGQEQLVIALLKFLPRLQIFHRDGLVLRMDGGNLMAHLHRNPESGEEALRRLQGQGLGIGDHIPDIVGQAAVGVGYIP